MRKNETFHNCSRHAQDHSGHAYGPGNDPLRPPAGPPSRCGRAGCPEDPVREALRLMVHLRNQAKNTDFLRKNETFHNCSRDYQVHNALEVRQEVAGDRSTRFRARTHALSGPEHAWNNYGKFRFFSKIHHFPHFSPVSGILLLRALRPFCGPMPMEGVVYGAQGGRQGPWDIKHCPWHARGSSHIDIWG